MTKVALVRCKAYDRTEDSHCVAAGSYTIAREVSMECSQEKNLESCNCSYAPCPRKGNCCQCLRYHLKSRQLPACCFPADAERTYDRSFEHFARLVAERRA